MNVLLYIFAVLGLSCIGTAIYLVVNDPESPVEPDDGRQAQPAPSP